MVPRGRIELPTPGFSVVDSVTQGYTAIQGPAVNIRDIVTLGNREYHNVTVLAYSWLV
jgi:hypothetical protein